MPELPEVETVVRTLENLIKNSEIQEVEVIYPRIVDNISANAFSTALKGQHFRTFSRRGKFLIFGLDDYNLVSHLRMEGKYFVTDDLSIKDKHTHLVFKLNDGRYLLYHDVRKFGRMQLYAKGEKLLSLNKLGLEPFDDDLNIDYLKKKFTNKPLKEVLLDQSVIAGIGNIYANEICFAISRDPRTPFDSLTDKELENLIIKTQEILKKAIEMGGTTIRSYTSSLGVTGRFQQNLFVHGQETCKKCGKEIVKFFLGGRGTYYCPDCQK